ncbi:uncharacterized [Tachysurus ichikawai]
MLRQRQREQRDGAQRKRHKLALHPDLIGCVSGQEAYDDNHRSEAMTQTASLFLSFFPLSLLLKERKEKRTDV